MEEANDIQLMRRAVVIARSGEGFVEPNPMVGCVLAKDGQIISEGFHRKFGGDHAEIEALNTAGKKADGATCYVTLEPCSHHGKTPPCTDALINAGVKQVVIGMRDPNPVVHGRGIAKLQQAGIKIIEGILENEVLELNAPYLTLFQKNRPFITAKWAMTLDGRLASWTGSSHWISGEASRQAVHRLRGRMDAIMIGTHTAVRDDALLTVRLETQPVDDVPHRRITDPTAPKVPLRVVLDSFADVSLESRLVQTAKEIPVLIVSSPDAPAEKVAAMEKAGCEILRLPQRVPKINPQYNRKRDFRREQGTREIPPEQSAVAAVHRERTVMLMEHLAKRQITNLLVEGGSEVFGTLFDMQYIDEVHVFIAPKLIGGEAAVPAVAGAGLPEMEFAKRLDNPKIEIIEQDVYVHGRLR
ncbi:MAG: bifunctional diaminohydroxyphosphoribosylaminopyrimidine deaminase/5-amino-6-(5-phosphoribosylamino)uracil reductase RibD [Planctomycetaceae bacterium]|jgi:diaminohydroxyphosphoribosylaminopyrimidine deaminase/5-amino-6-(5-phosphoribosylamino)uracil reductase|nr:bifunctional diaminohydroxyphosphoribosylaminopyrimidine deaminase/5-amino-6-(5-phosphoribosylamino)uracil reductase RibD [Planctomycetaceae bacterium]